MRELSNWFGVMVPAKTPRPIVQRLNSEIVKVLQDPNMIARLLENAALPLGSTPEEHETYLRCELERWSKAIKSAGVEAK